MRITSSMVFDRVVADIQGNQSRLMESQERASAQKKILRPSDDPAGTQYALDLDWSLKQVERYRQVAGAAQDRLDTVDALLGKMGDLLIRARQIAIQGAAPVPPQGHQVLAQEVAQLQAQLVDLANGELGGRYLFAGTDELTRPFAVVAGVLQFSGSANVPQREVAPGSQVPVGVDAHQTILDLYVTLEGLRQDLLNGDVASLSGQRLTELNQHEDDFLNLRTEAGALGNRMALAQDRLGALHLNLQKSFANTVDADLAQTVMDISRHEAAFQMSLQVSARVLQHTLLDFLR
ncbi:MAG: flagellar hook-associated protein FlgL [Bacillota bacterium]|nr:flagellar hook-associated protein FlgL [Bacillota bacterium]